jgi:hypothetical protein
MSSRAAQTHRLEVLSAVVHGCSFRNWAEDADLLPSCPEPVSGWFVVRLMRTGVTGRAGLYPDSPTDLTTLAAKGYDEWALWRVDPFAEDPR